VILRQGRDHANDEPQNGVQKQFVDGMALSYGMVARKIPTFAPF
jgi:hypothetical protein